MDKEKSLIRVAWIHNYNRDINPASGVFMYQLYNEINRIQMDVKVDLIDIGNINNPLKLVWKFIKLYRIIKGFDILHAQYGSGTGLFTSLFKAKKILSLRGSDWYYYPSGNVAVRFHSWIGCALTRLSISKFDRIIVMSDRMGEDIAARYPSVQFEVIPDGIDLKRFYPAGKKHMQFRVLFSSIDSENRLKRYDLAKEAFSIFHDRHPESELVFMNNVPHDKVNELINSAHVILLTSTHEGWPNIIKEGLACNVPFISTDVSDLKAIAEKTEICKICDPDPEVIANELENLFLNREPYRNAVRELRKFVEPMDIFIAVENIADQYKKIFYQS